MQVIDRFKKNVYAKFENFEIIYNLTGYLSKIMSSWAIILCENIYIIPIRKDIIVISLLLQQ